jgi:hypothetical protein
MTDQYEDGTPVPEKIHRSGGPEGVALVRAWKDGRTDPGWGLRKPDEGETSGFMWKYEAGTFRPDPIVFGFQQRRWNFALVMRSLQLVCIDIDGKNGGLTHAGKLGMLPYTLAETSKSGDGYHLYYLTSEDVWDAEKGYALFADRIALEQGVDLRATGCVYHHPQQKWNTRQITELPDHLKKRLTDHSQRAAAQTTAIIKLLDAGDDTEVLLMQDTLIEDLKKPIPAGRRNTTLFAIGQQMKLAQVPGWEKLVFDRATDLGLDTVEANKLVSNVTRYN